MKFGIISDIHGNSTALEVVLPGLLNEVDHVLFLGDLCGYYPFVNECVDIWDQDRISGVLGNHDQIFLNCLTKGTDPTPDYQTKYGSSLNRNRQDLSPSALSLLRSLQTSLTLDFDGTTIALFHGTPWDKLNGRVYPDYNNWDRFNNVRADIVLMGHTHYPFTKFHSDKTIINPGSVGQPRDRSGAACFAILELETRLVEHRRIPFDSNPLIEDANKYDPNVPYLIEVLTRK